MSITARFSSLRGPRRDIRSRIASGAIGVEIVHRIPCLGVGAVVFRECGCEAGLSAASSCLADAEFVFGR